MIPFIVTVLANAIWQPLLIAGITWAALRLSRCTNATTRHAVWTIALVASVAVPFISAASLVMPRPAETMQTRVNSAAPKLPLPIVHAPKTDESPSVPTIAVRRPHFEVRPTIAQVATAVWGFIALVVLARLAFSFFYLERLKHDALPLSVERRADLVRWDRAEKGSRDVRICVSDEISVPVAVGIFDAMILLPHELVDELDANDLDRILLHELAHVRRSDDWVNLFERIAMALFFFSPGIYMIARQMDLEREVACDDWVLAQAAENVPYARCLARIVEMTQWPYRAVAAPGVFVTRKSMSIRIERLLARGRDIRIRLAIVPSFISLVAIVAIVVAGGFLSPTIAYTMTSTSVAMPSTKIKPGGNVATKMKMKSVNTFELNESTKVETKTKTVVVPTLPPSPLVAAVYTPKATPAESSPPRKPAASSKRQKPVWAAPEESARPKSWPSPLGNNVVADAGYIDELAAAGFKNLSVDDIIAMKSVGVTGDYIKQMRAAGLTNLTARQLVELKSVGVTPDYISMMRAAGLAAGDARMWTEIKSVGVTPDYAAQMKNAGVTDFNLQRLVELKSVGVTPDYIQQMRNAGLGASDARTWTEMRSIGLSPDYVQQMHSAGLTTTNVRELTEMKSVGVSPDYVRDLASAGYPHLSAREYTEMKSVGVTPDYIRSLAKHGFNNLPVHKLVEFKSMGIDPQ